MQIRYKRKYIPKSIKKTETSMEIKIWGTRGSMPVSGAGYLKYGGETSCVEVRLASGDSILFDAGTGIVNYDRETPSDHKSRVICFTHTRYDHLQGLLFFSGAFRKNAPLLLIGPSLENGFEDSLSQFFNGVNTPHDWKDLPKHEIMEIKGGRKFEIYGASVEACPTIHPGGCLAWKITADGWTFAITGDHEIPLDKRDGQKNLANERLMSFLTGCDVVLADSFFSNEQHIKYPDSGHSNPAQWQKELTERSIGKIYFTHFNPAYTDKKLEELLTEAKGISGGLAYDGAVIHRTGLVEPPKQISCLSCEFSHKVAGFSDTHSVLDALLTSARKQANAEGGTVYLVSGGELNFAAAQNDKLFPKSSGNKFIYFNSHLPIDKSSIAGYVATTGKALNINDVYQLPENCEYTFKQELDQEAGYRTRSVLAVPLTNGKGNIVGVLQLLNANGFNGYAPFSEKVAEDIASLAQMATIPLERSFLVVAMILRILKTAALRDPAETTAHVQRVGSIAAELYHYWAEKHGMDPEEILFTKGQLRLAAMLHDVGKVGVPDNILKKPGKLTDHERSIMQTHSYLGSSLFGNSGHIIDKMAKDITLHHHARWDGEGYTGNKTVPSPHGENIPLWARITAIADVYDALVSPRPFRKVWTSKEAAAFLRHEAGKQFDPELVFDFREIMGTVQKIFERYPDTDI